MPTYSTEEMRKLYNIIESKIDDKDKEVFQSIMAKYNGIVRVAIRQKEYIEKHEQEYVDNMNQNHKLIEKNRLLEEKIDKLLIIKKCMQEELREKNAILRKLNIKV